MTNDDSTINVGDLVLWRHDTDYYEELGIITEVGDYLATIVWANKDNDTPERWNIATVLEWKINLINRQYNAGS